MTDIERKRREIIVRARRAARAQYLDRFSWSVEITAPRGFLGLCWAALMMITPTGLLVAFAAVGSAILRLRQRARTPRQP
jgi:hypothetical protein